MQVKAEVVTLLQALDTLESKQDVMFRHGVRMMNLLHEVRLNVSIATLVNNFQGSMSS